MDFKDYDSGWQRSARPSARGIIVCGAAKTAPDTAALPCREPLFRPEDSISLVYAAKLGYYKFPGGGIHAGEDKECVLAREIREETGLAVIPQSVREYGVAQRYQKSALFPDTIFEQDSFYYICDVERDGAGLAVGGQQLDDYENEEGFALCVVPIRDAIRANRRYAESDSSRAIMIARDTRVLEMLCGMPSEPPRCFARYLLEEGAARNPGPWREHSIAVAEAAEKVARALGKNAAACGHASAGTALDPGCAYVYGLLHDIGRREGHTYLAHVYDGYHFLLSFGYKNAARICLTHSFNLQTTDDYIGKHDITDAQFEELKTLLAAASFDDYDRLIQLLDSTCGADGTKNMELRMGDVKSRYGYYPQAKWDKNLELKAALEALLGCSLYDVI